MPANPDWLKSTSKPGDLQKESSSSQNTLGLLILECFTQMDHFVFFDSTLDMMTDFDQKINRHTNHKAKSLEGNSQRTWRARFGKQSKNLTPPHSIFSFYSLF